MRNPSRRAFTLVELLVVIGIITVLIAILLPVLAGARNHARTAQCAANLRSIGQALIAYAHRYQWYPPNDTHSQPDARLVAVWPVSLLEFLGRDRNVFYCPSQDDRCRWTDDEPLRPSGQLLLLGYLPEEPLVHASTWFSYGYNHAGNNFRGAMGMSGTGLGRSAFANGRHQAPTRLSRVVRPAEMVAIADSTVDGYFDYMISSLGDSRVTVSPDFPVIGRVHPKDDPNGGPNVLFCDGHVSWYPQDEMLIHEQNVTPADREKSRRWNYDHSDTHWGN